MGISNANKWPHDGLVDWVDGDTAYLSVAFTWKLDDAYQRAAFYRAQARIDAFQAEAIAALPKVVTTRPADGLCRDCGEPMEDGRQHQLCVFCAEEAEREKLRMAKRGR